jgi:transposase
MLNLGADQRIWLCTQPTDMRRSFDGLSTQVRQHLGEDPSGGAWFVFINRRRTQLKILAYEAGGYCIWAKRLEQGRFALSPSASGKTPLTRTALLALIEGIDIEIKRQRKRYKRAA